MPRARHLVLAVHCRSESGRRAGRPQDPRRPRGPRTGGVRRARRSSARLARRGLTADRALTEPLGAHHPHVRRIRALLRDRRARDAEGLFVCEGPRVVEAALEHGAELVECVVAAEATAVAHAVAERAAKAGVPVRALAPGQEAPGLDPGLPLDGEITIPMHAAESLNVAMAGTALLFEAARQRRAPS